MSRCARQSNGIRWKMRASLWRLSWIKILSHLRGTSDGASPSMRVGLGRQMRYCEGRTGVREVQEVGAARVVQEVQARQALRVQQEARVAQAHLRPPIAV